ncbi:hypothetical protein [Virgisporangium ochraceum]|uniref:hypothetical protein n=1 Tax=Virgisporangium ochraceum TaxID=65505 RepID=UPI001941EF79|nr:hypothetical protein [Virgisporangium ochraceum]
MLSWITLQVRRDPDPDTDTELDPAPVHRKRVGRRTVQVAENRWKIERYDLDKDELPPATPTPQAPNSQLHIWIRRSFDEGARYSDIVRDGQTLFKRSEASIKRAIREVRKGQKNARAGR